MWVLGVRAEALMKNTAYLPSPIAGSSVRLALLPASALAWVPKA